MPADTQGATISVIILTLNEETNLPDCLESLACLEAEVFIVDSGSSDGTVEIARTAGCQVFCHPFENYAAQRNWAFDHLPIRTPWILCLDADERLTPELAGETSVAVRENEPEPDGYMLRRRTVFMGRWLRFGGQYPAYHLRLFRTGKGRCEDRLYDQHFLVDGTVGKLKNDYIDVLTDRLSTWIERHNRWASLEAEELTGASAPGAQVQPRMRGSPIERKRLLRMSVYNRLPLFVRPFGLWFFDYVIRLGFLDGVPGLIFYTMQRFWFRFMIDANIYEKRQQLRGRRSEP